MKKTYIRPAMNITKVVQSLPIAGSLNQEGATFYQENATGAAMVKGSSQPNYNVWDDDWSN